MRSNATRPSSSLEFENRWRALSGDEAARRELLSTLIDPAGGAAPGDAMRSLFKSSLSGDTLFDLLDVIVGSIAAENARETLQLLDGLASVDRFSMTLMLLGKRRTAELAARWQKKTKTLEGLEALQPEWTRVCGKYGKILLSE